MALAMATIPLSRGTAAMSMSINGNLLRLVGPLSRKSTTCALSTSTCCGVHRPKDDGVGVAPISIAAQSFISDVNTTSMQISPFYYYSCTSSARRSCPKRAIGVTYRFSTASASSDVESNNHLDNDDDDDGIESLTNLSPAMQHRIRTMKSRHDELMNKLHDGGGGDQTALGKELSSLSGIATLCEKVSTLHAERKSLLELLHEMKSENNTIDDDSKEMIQEIKSELDQLEMKLQSLSLKMIQSLVPLLDPDNVDDLTSANAVIDIRAGTGGDEACLFAGEIMAAYEAIAKAGGGDDEHGGKAWELEVLSVSRTDLGGVKEASLVVSSRGSGSSGYSDGYDSLDSSDTNNSEQDTAQLLFQRLGPYGFFQYESGVHRVQRVPINDAKMQTSAVSVAVLPSIADSDVASVLPPSELKIDVMRASGAGGQHVNTTESAVRITHIPTGIMAYMQEERSQHKNRTKALKLVAARVHQLRKEQALKDRSSARSSLMGGGDRSERIRTYNYSQDRITDHRCKISVQGVSSWLGGGVMVRKFAPYLYEMEREERAVALEEEDDNHGKGMKTSRCGKDNPLR